MILTLLYLPVNLVDQMVPQVLVVLKVLYHLFFQQYLVVQVFPDGLLVPILQLVQELLVVQVDQVFLGVHHYQVFQSVLFLPKTRL